MAEGRRFLVVADVTKMSEVVEGACCGRSNERPTRAVRCALRPQRATLVCSRRGGPQVWFVTIQPVQPRSIVVDACSDAAVDIQALRARNRTSQGTDNQEPVPDVADLGRFLQ